MVLRRLVVSLGVLLLASCAHVVEGEALAQGPVANVDLGYFEQSLAPYGQWIDLPGYGPVWQPASMPADWQPYTLGHWEWTDQGWLWASDEPWGRIAFHYGRWARDPSYGWLWVPGYQWAPAWVAWRTGDDVIGWAPLGPGVSIELGATRIAPPVWVFVPARHFAGLPVQSYAFARGENDRWFRRSRPAPPRYEERGAGRGPVYGGPPPQFVQRWSGRPIPQRRVAVAPAPARPASPPPVYRPRPGGPRQPAPAAPAPSYPSGTGYGREPERRPERAVPAQPPVYRGGRDAERRGNPGRRGEGRQGSPPEGQREKER